MKRLLITGALLMAMSGVASADGRRDAREWAQDRADAIRDYEKDRAKAIRAYEKDRRKAEQEYWKDRREVEREIARDRREAEQDRARAYRQYAKAQRQWARGQYIPREYLVDRYYIRNYDAYHLAPPPSGYAWVRPYPQDNTYYLVQLATGIISRIFGG